MQEFYITAAQKCVMIKDDQNEKRKAKMLKSCRLMLKKEIYVANPEIVVTFGNVPFDMLKPSEDSRIHEARLLTLKDREFLWAPLAHPQQIKYIPGRIRDAELILRSLKMQLDFDWEPLYEDPGVLL